MVCVDDVVVPPIFHGSALVWTVEAEGGVVHIPGREASPATRRDRGYIHKVLWLAKDIEEWFDGRSLEWRSKL